MEQDIKNKESGLLIKDRNNIKPGAYVIVKGKLIPDANDEAMRSRHKLKKKTETETKKDLPAEAPAQAGDKN